uniref:peptidylprolyl isomerase n=1 Tax=Myripristis murdjan TaxID=586833 RepID=A0A667XJQ2_9TELE
MGVEHETLKQGDGTTFPKNGQTVTVHYTAKLTCSPDYAYGARGYPPLIPGNSTLIFEVELLKIDS